MRGCRGCLIKELDQKLPRFLAPPSLLAAPHLPAPSGSLTAVWWRPGAQRGHQGQGAPAGGPPEHRKQDGAVQGVRKGGRAGPGRTGAGGGVELGGDWGGVVMGWLVFFLRDTTQFGSMFLFTHLSIIDLFLHL